MSGTLALRQSLYVKDVIHTRPSKQKCVRAQESNSGKLSRDFYEPKYHFKKLHN